MGFDNNNSNNGQSRPTREEVFNKVSFSSVKLGNTKQGSPTVGLYLKGDQLKKLHGLVTELLEKGEDGCKLSCIVIAGKDYDSGYAYVNPKEPKKESNGTQPRPPAGGSFQRRPGGFKGADGNADNKSAARNFFQSKRLPSGEEGNGGN